MMSELQNNNNNNKNNDYFSSWAPLSLTLSPPRVSDTSYSPR